MYSAVILAGGFGTRLKPLTDTVPKPMLPVGGEPNLVRLCDLLCRNGFDSAVVTLKYMPDKIRDRLTDSCRGVDLYYVCEDEPKGTAGAVKAASPLCRDDFLVISGDAVCEIDLSSAYEAHKKKRRRGDDNNPQGDEAARIRLYRMRQKRQDRFVLRKTVVAAGRVRQGEHRDIYPFKIRARLYTGRGKL